MANNTINKNIYIRTEQSNTQVRLMKSLSEKHKTQSKEIVAKFITLLKAEHT
jgi:hypothetical protein